MSRPSAPDDFAALEDISSVGLQRISLDAGPRQALAESASATERIGVEGLWQGSTRRLHRALLPRLLGRAVRRAWGFDRSDQADRRWWPQGISTAEESTLPQTQRQRILATTWYAKKQSGHTPGSRITFVDTARHRYQHVLLVHPVLRDGRAHWEPVPVHAGGLVWVGDWLHVAATARGMVSARADGLLRIPEHLPAESGHRYLLPITTSWRSDGADLRWSFISHDPVAGELLLGEYGRGAQSTRLASFALNDQGEPRTDAQGSAHPLFLDRRGVAGMQGVLRIGQRTALSVSRGPWHPGDLLTGRPGAMERHPGALPMGNEDLALRRWDNTLWTITEHPYRRWIVQCPGDWGLRTARD